jgi:hypothetical protein
MTQGPKTKVKTEKDYLYEIIQAQREKEQGLN